MGRLATKPIMVPSGVDVRIANGVLTVKGVKGELTRRAPHEISFTLSGDGREVTVSPTEKTKNVLQLLGTTYIHTRNMISGVSEGFTKTLELEGVGYRASVEDGNLILSLGYSHPVRYAPPQGIELAAEKNTIRVSGIDKEAVGQAAAAIRAFREPEPYKGKGIRYQGEHITRKQGKKAGVG